MSFPDRSLAAMLGLALGDAYGRRLEFVRGPRVRTTPAGPGHDFMWTDDTHMALYAGEACLDHGAGPLDVEQFAFAIGTRFVEWLDDPLMPSTAPGNTCLAGSRAWRQSQDWTASGVTHSDGCGAVMRVCPLPILFDGSDLREAAATQAALTHAHPNAIEAAQAACELTRRLLDGELLDDALVLDVADNTAKGSTVDRALRAAVALAEVDADWLDEAAIPDGDGGWRAPSALGLAVAAALRWGPQGFTTAIDKAARINGDSDSVACLAGMLLGAAGGTKALPLAWLDALPDRDRIEDLVRRLVSVPQPRSEVWIAVADLHGHREHLDALIAAVEREHGDRWRMVTLGDYVDNGPDVPGLIDRLIELRATGRVQCILGNHDLACLRALGGPDGPDEAWCARWARRYWGWRGGSGSTPAAYGAESAHTLGAHMPATHKAFLASLPWSFDTGEFLFVHAGMEPGSLAAQHRALIQRRLPDERLHLPPPIRDKGLCAVSDPDWDRVVVSGHTKKPASRPGVPKKNAPHFATSNRICLSGEVDQTGVLYAVELPSRRLWRVGPDLSISYTQELT